MTGRNGLKLVDAASDALPLVLQTRIAAGHFLDAIANRYPEVVLGAQAASVLGIESLRGHPLVYLDDRWFAVVGILHPVVLDSSLDSVAFISLPVATRLFGQSSNPTEIYVRSP